jgi:hypothetical protein
MIELYIIPNIDQPWKRELIGEYKSPEHCQAKAGFTRTEMTAGLNGDVIQGKYIIEFAPRWLHNLAIDEILSENDGLTEQEISDALGIKQQVASTYLKRAIEKLKNNDGFRKLLHEVIKFKNRGETIEITTINTIRIESD